MKSLSGLARTMLFACFLAASSGAFAHSTYNVSGYAGSFNPFFSLSGDDGLGLPSPTYSGGSGPNATTTGLSFYSGALPVNWMAALHEAANTAGEVFILNSGDALGRGATTPNNFLLAAGGAEFGTGLDFGLIRVDHAQNQDGHGVKVTVSADLSLGSTLQPYIAIYQGWDHSWEGPNGTVKDLTGGSTATRASALLPATDNPFGSDLKWVTTVDNTAGLSTVSTFFTASEISHFTLLIGGANGTAGGYTAVVETALAQVPLPAAVWLFGAALGALAARRRSGRGRVKVDTPT